jgi:hypothetical protein
MAGLLALYLAVVLLYAARLIGDALPIAQAIGWALIVLPLIGVWALAAELRFGFAAERLARRLEADGGLPNDIVPVRASGRVERDAADAAFSRHAEALQQHPESWAHWFRLALAYDAARDRRRARWALREAMGRERADRRARGSGQPATDDQPSTASDAAD